MNSRINTKTKKATFNLQIGVLQALDEAVKGAGRASKNAFVEQALRKELAELRRQERRKLLEEAAKDPLFLKDIEDVERDFQYADAETARQIV